MKCAFPACQHEGNRPVVIQVLYAKQLVTVCPDHKALLDQGTPMMLFAYKYVAPPSRIDPAILRDDPEAVESQGDLA